MIFDKEYILNTEVWQDDFLIVFTSSIQSSISKRFIKYKIKDSVPNVDYTAAYFMPMRDTLSQPFSGWILFDLKHIDDGIILHECLHATSNILRHRGFSLNDESEEAFTYTQQFIFNKVVKLHKQVAAKYKLYAKKK